MPWTLLRRLVLLLGLAALWVTLGRAQTVPVAITQVSDEGGVITTVATVLDPMGRPAPALPAEAFTVRVDGRPAPVTEVRFAADPATPLAVVLAIDASGSMRGERFDKARLVARDFLDSLGPADQVALLVFNQTAAFFSDFTTDRTALKQRIQGLGAAGDTALFQATVDAANKAASAPLTRKAVVLLSDGENFGASSRTTRDQALDAAGRSGVPFYVVGLGGGVDQQFLDELARVSRGQSLNAPNPDDLDRLYRGIGDSLRGQYVIRARPEPVKRALTHALQISVRLDGGLQTAETTFEGSRLALQPEPTPPPPTPAPATPAPPTPIPVTPAAIVTVAPVIVPASAPSATTPTANRLWLLLAAIGAGGLLVGSAVWWRMARQARTGESDTVAPFEPSRPPEPLPLPVSAAPAETPPAILLVQGGPLTGLSVPVEGDPITIGSAAGCAITLPGGDAERRHARIWRRDGRYMLHRLARDGALTMNGRPVVWAVLEPGDQFEIGQHRFQFQPATAAATAAAAAPIHAGER